MVTRMAEYIEREDAYNVLTEYYHHSTEVQHEALREAIERVPAADVQPVKHGKNLNEEWPSLFECSICHWSCWDTYCGDTDIYNYCPNCGARMDGEQ